MSLIFFCLDCKRTTERPGFNLGGVPLLPCSLCNGELCECSPEHDIEFSSSSPDEVLATYDRDWDEPRFLEPKSELIEPDFLDDGSEIDDIVLSPREHLIERSAKGPDGRWNMKLRASAPGWG